MSSVMDLIKQKRQQMDEKKAAGIRPIKPTAGKHKYRVLPGWRGDSDPQFWHDYGQHFIKVLNEATGKEETKAVFLCQSKTHGKDCAVCEAIYEAKKIATTDAVENRLGEAYASQKYLINVLHLTGSEPNKPQLMEIGPKIFEQILEIMDEYDDITSLDKGTDLVINRQGSGFETTYTVVPAGKSKPVDPSVMTTVINIDSVVAGGDQQGETRALSAVGSIVGLTVAADNVARIGSDSKSGKALEYAEAEDAEFDDAVITAPAKTTKAVAADDSEADLTSTDDLDVDDELDSLLDGLDDIDLEGQKAA